MTFFYFCRFKPSIDKSYEFSLWNFESINYASVRRLCGLSCRPCSSPGFSLRASVWGTGFVRAKNFKNFWGLCHSGNLLGAAWTRVCFPRCMEMWIFMNERGEASWCASCCRLFLLTLLRKNVAGQVSWHKSEMLYPSSKNFKWKLEGVSTEMPLEAWSFKIDITFLLPRTGTCRKNVTYFVTFWGCGLLLVFPPQSWDDLHYLRRELPQNVILK